MIRKRQIVALVSIAVVSFLVGTSMATDGGNPFNSLWNAIFGLESRVETLEEQSLPQGFVTAPAYDSGWMNVAEGTSIDLEHGLGTTELFVYVLQKFPTGLINQIGVNEAGEYGVQWWSYSTVLRLIRGVGTPDASDSIRVMIWRIPEPPT